MQKLAATDNKNRKWNEATVYYPVELDVDGKHTWFMFTANQLMAAKRRADRNPEDIPNADASLLGKLFNWILD